MRNGWATSERSHVALTVESLSPRLTGIGRYTWELCCYFEQHFPSSMRYYRNGQWVDNPGVFLSSDENTPQQRSTWLQRRVRRVSNRWRVRSSLFHGPNFFLPNEVDGGIVTVHDLSVFKFPETHPIERVQHFELAFERTLGKAFHIITDTLNTRQEVIDFTGFAPERVTAIPLGVSRGFHGRSLEVLQPIMDRYGLKPQEFSLCVSTMEPRKRIAEMISAYGALPSAVRRRWPLVLVGGKGWHTERIDAAIEKGESEGWLRYLGYLPESQLPLFYAAARLFLYLSTYEGFGLPPIEAMASGTPVLVSDRSCLPEVTQGAALTVNPDDDTALVEAISRALMDEQWRTDARARGLAVAAGYSWETCGQKTVALYEQMLAVAC